MLLKIHQRIFEILIKTWFEKEYQHKPMLRLIYLLFSSQLGGLILALSILILPLLGVDSSGVNCLPSISLASDQVCSFSKFMGN